MIVKGNKSLLQLHSGRFAVRFLDSININNWVVVSNIFYFHRILVEMIQFDEHIFGMGWFNHQLDTLPETNSSPLKMDGWNTSFLLGGPIFRGELLVSGSVSPWKFRLGFLRIFWTNSR